ncbi:hypothetical protein N7456_001015 [Penicillium angulare]|uniref:Transaldolase n=1 Tax=Penicillium angulare TaxID=116970 RepID=A0A9W9GDA1_9EURO|nr:hypothetical protein N7456_001015 [Penicillium angulare]
MNALEYLRFKTQVDLDALDLDVAKNGALGKPYVDATSNQIEVYFQLKAPNNAEVVQTVMSITAEIHKNYHTMKFEELAVETASVYLAARILPYISGNVHVMANPFYSFHAQRIVEAGRRYHSIFHYIDPTIDLNRVVMKVPATWEGLQACRALTTEGIKTLGTTVFSMEQCILAGEVGCVSVSPFINDLKRLVDPSYKDNDPLIGLCVEAQQYYKQHGIATCVKACSAGSLDEILQLAGVDAYTIETSDLDALAKEQRDQVQLETLCLFKEQNNTSAQSNAAFSSYVDDECRFRMDLAASKQGQSQFKLYQSIGIFCDFQRKAERLFNAARS